MLSLPAPDEILDSSLVFMRRLRQKDGELHQRLGDRRLTFQKDQVMTNDDLALFQEWLTQTPRSWQMPGDGRYQPEELKAFLGYDQWSSWLIIVEYFWLMTLAKIGTMPPEDAQCLSVVQLEQMLEGITTTRQDEVEKETKHDILALLQLMRQYLPKPLHRWLHFGATSYDIVNTAYALQIKYTFAKIFWPKIEAVDKLWREKIGENARVIQAGRTHLQTALPVTAGFWLATLHGRFRDIVAKTFEVSRHVPGKFSGAVGTYAAQRALIKHDHPEAVIMQMLGLPAAWLSTQITPPEAAARFYHELVLLSGVMANLGEDARILQSTQFGELKSASSSSSTMAHKTANPIAAEQLAGMHMTVLAEFNRIDLTLVSDLQRDLRWSNVMRGYSAVMVYVYQQLLTTERLLKSMTVDAVRCRQNFDAQCYLVMGELLHLALQGAGYAGTHELVNKILVPAATKSGRSLVAELDDYLRLTPNSELQAAWDSVGDDVTRLLMQPDQYFGDAIKLATLQAGGEIFSIFED